MPRRAPFLILLLWSLWLSSAYFTSGAQSYIRQHDTAEVNTPYYTALPLLHSRNLAGLRDPLAGTGVDALSNLKGDMPLVEAFFRVWPHWSNSGALLFCQTLLAAIGMHLLLRRRFQVSTTSALIGAAWFAWLPAANVPYSGFPTWYGLYIPALPLVLLALLADRRDRLASCCLAMVCGALCALGAPTASGLPMLVVVTGTLVAFSERRAWPRALALGALFSAAFLAAKLPAIVALIASASDSHRIIRAGLPFGTSSAAELWISRVSEAREILLPNAPMLGIALVAWIAGGFRRRTLNVTWTIIAVIVAATLVTPLLQGWQGALGGVFRTYQIDRVNRFMPFFAALAGAVALDHLGRSAALLETFRAARVALAFHRTAVACLVLSMLALSGYMNLRRERARVAGNRYDVFFSQPALQSLASRQNPGNLFRVATFADRNANQFGLHAAFAWAYGLETADVYGTMYPRRYHQFWQKVIEPARDDRADIRDYFDRWGNMAYLFNPSGVLFDPLPPGVSTRLASLPFNLNLLSLANVRYLISRVPLTDPRLSVADRTSELLVYENRDALPRFFVVHDWTAHESPDEVLAAISRMAPEQLRCRAVVAAENAEDTGLVAAEGVAPGSVPPATCDTSADRVDVARYEADVIELDVRASGPGLLIASNAFNRYWNGHVDGRPQSVIPAYHAFLAVPIAQGQHRVALRYEPPHASWFGAHRAALLAAILALGALCVARRSGRFRNAGAAREAAGV